MRQKITSYSFVSILLGALAGVVPAVAFSFEKPDAQKIIASVFERYDPEEFDNDPLNDCKDVRQRGEQSSGQIWQEHLPDFVGFDLLSEFNACIWYPEIYSDLPSLPADPANMPANQLAVELDSLAEEHITDYNDVDRAFHLGQRQTSDPDSNYLRQECQLDNLREMIWQLPPSTPDLVSKKINEFLFSKGCLNDLKIFDKNGLTTLLKIAKFKYDFMSHPFIKPMQFKLGQHHVVRGALALKPGGGKRPLIIIRCGTFCDATDGLGTGMLISHYYDSTPFNVLVLSNMTGIVAQHESGEFAAGGPIEAGQVLDILKFIETQPYADEIKGVHYAGMSLGGHGALYTGLTAGHPDNKLANDDLNIRSTNAICPVSDLPNSVKFVYDANADGVEPSGLQEFVFLTMVSSNHYGTASWLRRFNDDGPLSRSDYSEFDFDRYGPSYYDIQFELVYDFYHRVMFEGPDSPKGFRIYPPLDAGKELVETPFKDLGSKKDDVFAAFDQYLKFANWTTQASIPTYVHYSENDYVVPQSLNGTLLKAQVAELQTSGEISDAKGNNLFAFVGTEHGSHCGQGVSYSYPHVTHILNASVINAYTEAERRELFSDYLYSLPGGEREDHKMTNATTGQVQKIAYHYSVQPSGKIAINLSVTKQTGASVDYNFLMDFTELGKIDADLMAPLNDVHAEALTRWANVNLQLIDKDGKDVRVSRKPVVALKWWGIKRPE